MAALKIPSLSTWAAPLLLVAFSGVQVAHVKTVFSLSMRWNVLAVAFLLIAVPAIRQPLYGLRFVQFTFAFVFWAMASTFWSESPSLSLMKSVALFAVVFVGTGSGYLWVRGHRLEQALDLLAPMTGIVLIAALGGMDTVAAPSAGGDGPTYQGLTGNSNTLGTLCAMVLPLPLWRFHVSASARGRILSGIVGVGLAAAILLSNSRGAIAIALAAFLGFMAARASRNIVLAMLAGAFVVGIAGLGAIAFPELRAELARKYVYKDLDGRGSGRVLQSRDLVWAESFEQALAGGIVGGGYGVNIGSEVLFDGSLTAENYGREKGNSQLGIVEELGVAGLLLYLTATLGMLLTYFRAARRCLDPQLRSAQGMILGVLVGMTVQSMVEAWFNAPGSVESAYYWVMAGVGAALVTGGPAAPAVRSAHRGRDIAAGPASTAS